MKKLYNKSEIWFTVLWIVIYLIGYSVSEMLSQKVGITSSITVIFNLILSAVIYFWIRKNGLLKKYGLCKVNYTPKFFLYYIPLAIISTHNFWNGFAINLPFLDTVCYIVSMLCVGFLEEVLFRGFLFKAISKDSVKTAIVVTSLIFGLGHLLNLFNGSGVTLVANLCVVFGAIGVGFLFAVIFYQGGSLIPCIVTHGLYDAFSAFGNEVGLTDTFRITINVIQFIVVVLYGIYILRKAKRNQDGLVKSPSEDDNRVDIL